MDKDIALIIDDEECVRFILSEHIKRGVSLIPISAVDGEEGLEKVLEYGSRIAYIFLDNIMPGMSGAEFARVLYRDHPECREVNLVSISATAENNDYLGACKKFKNHQRLAKPISKENLLETLSDYVNN